MENRVPYIIISNNVTPYRYGELRNIVVDDTLLESFLLSRNPDLPARRYARVYTARNYVIFIL